MAQKVIRFDRVTLDASTRRRDADGCLIVRGKFARTGLQTYSNGDGTDRIEYRSEEEVKRSAPTFEGVTITDLHPDPEMVDPDTWKDLAKGHAQDCRWEEDGWLTADFYIADGDLAKLVEDGERTELSAGYFAAFDDTPGDLDGSPYDGQQLDITGNHIATLPKGTARAGSDARLLLDSKGNQIPPGPDPQSGDRRDSTMEEIQITIGGITYTVKADSTAAQALRKRLARADEVENELEKAVEEREAQGDEEEAEVAALKARIEELEKELEAAKSTDAIDGAVAERLAIIAKAKAIAGDDVDLTRSDEKGNQIPLTNDEIRVKALTVAGRKLDGKSPIYIEAAFDYAADHAANRSTVRDAISPILPGTPPVILDEDPLQEIWDARDRMNGKEA